MTLSLQEEIRKNLNLFEYNNPINKQDIRSVPEIPEWAYNLSKLFTSDSCSEAEVEKSVKIMANRVIKES